MIEQEKYEQYQLKCVKVAGVLTVVGLVACLIVGAIMQKLTNNAAMNILLYVDIAFAACAVVGLIAIVILLLSGLVKMAVKRKVAGKQLAGVVDNVDAEKEYNVWYVYLFFKKFVANVEVS